MAPVSEMYTVRPLLELDFGPNAMLLGWTIESSMMVTAPVEGSKR